MTVMSQILNAIGGMSQNRAAEEAMSKIGEGFDYQKEINEPIIQMGDEQLQALKQGIESGAFSMDEGLFADYQMYVAPEYEPGGKFQYEPRQNLVTPEKFQYVQQQPQFNYNQGVQQFSPYQQTPAAPQFNPYQAQAAPQFNPYQSGTWQAPQAPQARQIDPQFQTQMYQPQTRQPQFYRAQNANPAEYYDPTREQYQSREFNLQNDPVYQRRIEETNKAIESSAAARGMQLSGATLKALQENTSEIAAEEGQAAWDRWRQEDQTGYQRFQDQQSRVQDATRYRSEDEYRRYLDSVGIRGAEADRRVSQWNTDRSFGASQSTEAFERENVEKQLGRQLNDDEWNRYIGGRVQEYGEFSGQQAFGQNAAVQNFNTGYGAYADTRDFGQQATIGNFLTGYGAYQDQRDFGQNAAVQNYLTGLQGQGQGWGQAFDIYGTDLGQFNTNRQYMTGEDQRFIDNTTNAYNINNANYSADRQFGYGVDQDYQNRLLTAYGINTGNRQAENAAQYGLLTDAYNRQQAERGLQYGRIGDLVNLGMGARQNLAGGAMDYYNTYGDLLIQQGNARGGMYQNAADSATPLGGIGM